LEFLASAARSGNLRDDVRYPLMKTLRLSSTALATCALALSACSTPSSTTPPATTTPPLVDCRELAAGQLRLWAEGSALHVAQGKSKSTVVHVDPDLCVARTVSVSIDDARVAKVSLDSSTFDIEHPTRTLRLEGLAEGSATVTLELTDVDGKVVREGIPVVVGDERAATCSGETTALLEAGGRVVGVGGIAGASAAVPAYASLPATQGYRWPFTATNVTIGCGQAALPDNALVSLSPAVRFKQQSGAPWRMRREIDFRIPVNLARMPEKASLRHVEMWFSNEKFVRPRAVPVADLRLEYEGSRAFLAFKAPAYGTWEARVKTDAGTKKYMRRLTHRAAIGVSMGGAGTAIVGMNNHERWDTLAPLGGPVDLTWLLQHIGQNHTAGFPTNDGETAPTTFADPRALERQEIPALPYEHRSTFNEWWYEYPKDGNGGSFDRGAYSQIFRDLGLAFGSWNGPGTVEGGETLPLGVPANDKSFLGTRNDRGCAIYGDPVSGDPFEQQARDLERTCPTQRCSNGFRALHYYDDEFNPKGKWPVISVCDGGQQQASNSPWANQFVGAHSEPLEVALAVDYNDNGVRDANEPIIRSGHEPFRDWGTDGKPSAQEAGYAAGVNEDPAGDDYDAQFNPLGTEGNGHREESEAFDDWGLDGVRDTPSDGKQWDHGEGNGVYDEALGLRTMGKTDPHAIAMGWASPKGGAFKGDAARRVDLWLDGGTRDLFNFGSSAQSLAGALFTTGKSTGYITSTRSLPNATRFAANNDFDPGRTAWADLPSVVFHRYGQTEPAADGTINPESGKHVGTAPEIEARLRSALYFIGSRWPDAPRYLTPRASDAPAPGALDCEVTGNCSFEFKATDGRRGPVTVSLPPGYAHEAMQGVRFPVIYMLHGYGMEPSSLSAAIVFIERWMNSPQYSAATRMPKAILVYVDGRCRFSTTGEPECYRGNFYTDSPRKGGVQASKWWLELMGEVDRRFRTMPESTVEFTE
jgi:hypothetical protein